jgi:hypothetical protein
MTKWEYCKIVQPVSRTDGPPSEATLWFLGATQDETRTMYSSKPDNELARLGAEGWEMVSHTQVWGVMKGGTAGTVVPAPVLQVYYLKRPFQR